MLDPALEAEASTSGMFFTNPFRSFSFRVLNKVQKIFVFAGLIVAGLFVVSAASAQLDSSQSGNLKSGAASFNHAHAHGHNHHHSGVVSLKEITEAGNARITRNGNPLLVEASFQDRRQRGQTRNRIDRRRGDRGNNRQRARDARRGGQRGDRSRRDRPRSDRPRSDRPRGDRPRSDRPRNDRPRSERPRGDRPRGDRPRGDRLRGDRSRGDRRSDRYDRRSDRRRYDRRSDRRDRRYYRRHVRDRGYSRTRYSSRRYSGRRYAHGYNSRRGHGYYCLEHALFHYFVGFDPLGFSRVSHYGRSSYRYPSSCYPVEKIGYHRGRKALLRAILCYDAYDYPYLRRGSRYVVDYY